MSADLNRVTLVGRLTRTPQVAHTRNGDPVATLRLAVTSRARNGEDGWTDRPNYFDVVVWGRQAEIAADHLAKGRRIGVDGRLSWREWQDADGANRQAVEVVASDLFFLDSRKATDTGGAEASGTDGREAQPVSATSGGTGHDDDIPF